MDKIKKSDILLMKILLILIIFSMFFNPIIDFFVNVLWFNSINYISTFWIIFYSKLKIFLIINVLISSLIYYYFYILNRNYHKYFEDELSIKNKNRYLKLGFGSVIAGTIFAYSFTNFMWKDILLFFNAQSFNQTDPIFNFDISFYVFKLPLIKSILSMIIFILFWMTIVTVLYFVLVYKKKKISKEKVIDFNEYHKKLNLKQILCSHSYRSLIRAIVTLSIVILMLLGVNYILMSYKLLYSSLGIIYGAGYTDVKITLLFYRILTVVSFIAAIIIFIGYKKNSFKIFLSGPIMVIGIHFIALIVAFGVQKLVVLPDEISKEEIYISNNLTFTQKAYGIDNVDFINYDPQNNLSYDEIEKQSDIIDNIMVNDYRPLKQTFNEIQGIRMYYKFNDVDVDRYQINGKYTQIFITAREISLEKLRSEAKTWLNQHFKYTHGYGAVLSPVNAVDEEGQPKLLVKNIPPISDVGIIVNEPRIYFGELISDYIIVNSDEYEFDYPFGDDNKEIKYSGKAGVSLNGINKLLFAIKNRSLKLLVSSNINNESKIVFNRNIYKRLDEIAPFFKYDKDPYIVLNQNDGKIYWIIDAFTTTKNYPYSKPFLFNNSKINYMRNSIKVVIDAYDGTIDYYKFADEPIVNAYDKIFPDLLKNREEMPIGLKNHIKYPQDFFNLQAQVYEIYHVDNPKVFYNGEDVWQVANEKYMDMEEISRTNSQYVTFKLPESQKIEFLLSVPFTPNDKGNMTSLFVARNDADNYGNLFVYKFPKDKLVKGPVQIETQIDQDSVISPQFTLWGQKGSKILRGSVIIIPISNSLIYIEPIYLQAENQNSLPEMKKVIVFYNNKIVMEDTLKLSLKKMFEYEENGPMHIKDISDLSQRQIDLLNEITVLLNQYKENVIEIELLIDEFNELNK
ncbi:MAG: UPF0182 family protein [Bacillota bacterium]|nr:UPF0182 family protein [Bacillota bacterium]